MTQKDGNDKKRRKRSFFLLIRLSRLTVRSTSYAFRVPDLILPRTVCCFRYAGIVKSNILAVLVLPCSAQQGFLSVDSAKNSKPVPFVYIICLIFFFIY